MKASSTSKFGSSFAASFDNAALPQAERVVGEFEEGWSHVELKTAEWLAELNQRAGESSWKFVIDRDTGHTLEKVREELAREDECLFEQGDMLDAQDRTANWWQQQSFKEIALPSHCSASTCIGSDDTCVSFSASTELDSSFAHQGSMMCSACAWTEQNMISHQQFESKTCLASEIRAHQIEQEKITHSRPGALHGHDTDVVLVSSYPDRWKHVSAKPLTTSLYCDDEICSSGNVFLRANHSAPACATASDRPWGTRTPNRLDSCKTQREDSLPTLSGVKLPSVRALHESDTDVLDLLCDQLF